MNRVESLRGPVPGKRHNARTIAALTGNPGCTRRAVLDAAGVDKPKLAEHIGCARDTPPPLQVRRFVQPLRRVRTADSLQQRCRSFQVQEPDPTLHLHRLHVANLR